MYQNLKGSGQWKNADSSYLFPDDKVPNFRASTRSVFPTAYWPLPIALYSASPSATYYLLSPLTQYAHSVETGQPKFANRLLHSLILHQQARKTQNAKGTTLMAERKSSQ